MPRRPLLRVLVLLLVSFAARAEFPVTEERPLAPTLGVSNLARVVATDSGFLAIWKTRTTYGSEGLAQIARLSREGDLQERATAWTLPAAFAWFDGASNGDQVLLAGQCQDQARPPLCLARFSAAGDFLSLLRLPFGDVVAPAVASNGDGFIVTFSLPFPREVLAVPVSRGGGAGDAIVVGAWDPYSQWSSAAAMGGAYFVAYGAPGNHLLARLSSSATEASVPLTPPIEISQVRIESSGDRILVLTTPKSASAAADRRMRAAVFDRDLVQRTNWFPLDGGTSLPRIAPTTSGWIVAAEGAEGATVVSVSREGVAGEPTLVPGIRGFVIDAAARDERAALVWTTDSDSTIPGVQHNAVRIALFDQLAALRRQPSTISLGPVPQIHPAAAHAGGVSLAAWVETTIEGHLVVKARPFDAEGSPLASSIAMPFRGSKQTRPAVASDGTSFFVVWSEGDSGLEGVSGARVSPGGELLDPEAIRLFAEAGAYPSNYRTADVAWSGTSWIVTTSDDAWRIVGRRVSPAGADLDPFPVEIWGEPQRASFTPAIDCNGSECLVAFQGPPTVLYECHFDPCPPSPPSVRARRITSDLQPLDAAARVLTIDYEYLNLTAIEVSWNERAEAWLVAWSREGGQRIARDGTLLDTRKAPHFYSWGSLSAIPEADGWRFAWSSQWLPAADGSPFGFDIFHAWSRTALFSDVRERHALTRSAEREWDPRLVPAERPLAFFMRESAITAGSPQVIGRFLDEATPFPANLVLSASRLDDQRVRLSWTTDIPEISLLRLMRFEFGWNYVGPVSPSDRSIEVDLPAGRAARFVLRAETPSGTIESNVADVPGSRARAVTR